MKERVIFIVKLVVSLVLLIYLVVLIDWPKALSTLRGVNKLILLIVPALYLTGLWFASLRWRLILRDNNVIYARWQVFRAYWLALFYGQFLPGVLGGDAVRLALCLRQTKCQAGTATASILLERVAGVIALFTVALGVYLAVPSVGITLLSVEDASVIMILAGLGILGIVVFLVGRRLWSRWLPSDNATGILAFLRSAMQTLSAVKESSLLMVLLLSALFQMAEVVVSYVWAQAMGLDLSLFVFLGVVPIVYVVTVLPISLGGLGVREGTWALLLTRFGTSAADAATLAFLIYLSRMFVGGMGGVVQFLETLSMKRVSNQHAQ